MTEEKGERIAKRLARAGLCSRREAERWIEMGRVSVNGKTLDSPACVVGPGDIILVDGTPLSEPEKTRLWRYHKPAGLVTTHKDPEGRPTVFDHLPEGMPRVISVGRLDLNSEGLLLLTNDGELARKLELPSNAWLRRYRVRVHGEVSEDALARLENGITIDGMAYGPISATLDRRQGANAWLSVSLREGKNREIRRVMEFLGWPVSRLIRVSYGPFQLGTLEEGAADEVAGKVLREQMGEGKAVLKPRPENKSAGEREKEQRVAAKARKQKLADDKHAASAKKAKSDAHRRRSS
ncbi:Ribosomal large subunit pseudouridine synthase B [Paramagnetospirillum magnetotacticum MS-1]|uniref:Pseudouridine synthase n=1 Tax=Paramagnetospirillum magnetotacticum MS-1 TaxID=272627 RepID=A0A0C2U7Q4_PARME|nr:pseudouridine synthase [Paramagnetospirillum magnetotacticum]KIL97502.1 Ribosomal large subunit pseudouridine synthase B [Paramagnetospirillum magnetotacticum MS-1]